MPHELELLRNQMDRLEHQLRWFKIAAVVLALLAIAFALAPTPSPQQPESIPDRRTSVVSRTYLDDRNRAWLSFTDFTQSPAMIRRYGLAGEETIRAQ